MIEYIEGKLAEISPTQAVVDCHGVGYGISISLNTYSAIQHLAGCKLYVYEAIREDAHVLYGFADKRERELFVLLVSVSGIGGNTARTLLSALSPDEICRAVGSGDARLLTSAKGIGLKTAQRIIVDLKDKVVALDGTTDWAEAGQAGGQVADEAVAALTMLGFGTAPSQKVVSAILREQPSTPVEQVIKLALKQL